MWITEYNLSNFEKKFAKLERLCEKHGLRKPSWEQVGSKFEKVRYDDFSLPVKIKKFEIEIDSELPVVNGWECIARIDHTCEKNFLFGKEELPERFRETSAICEHCKTDRYRKDTFVLRNIESGEYKQVGRNCLADFLRIDVESLLQISSCLQGFDDGDEDGRGFARPDLYFDLEGYLIRVSACIREFGWSSRSNGEAPTADTALRIWQDGDFIEKNPRWGSPVKLNISNSDADIAKKTVEWFRQIDDDSDYIYNCRLLAESGALKKSQIGFAASMILTYQREIEKQTRLEIERGQSEFIGKIKERRNFELTYISTNCFDSHYGVTFLHKFQDTDGNQFIWFASNDLGYVIQEAKNYSDFDFGMDIPVKTKFFIKGTVKEHKEYQGVKQTVLTRCKALQIIQ